MHIICAINSVTIQCVVSMESIIKMYFLGIKAESMLSFAGTSINKYLPKIKTIYKGTFLCLMGLCV